MYFIDYGNYEQIQKDEVKDLGDVFRTLPAQAIHCGLHGVLGTEIIYL